MSLGVPTLDDLVRAAADAPRLFLPRVESHPAGVWLGAASLGLGVVAARWDDDGHVVLGWLALAGMLVAMVLHALLKRARTGWSVDFAARTVTPRELPGEAVTIDGAGWSIACAPGERRQSIAIDLRHVDRGRVARLYDSAARLRGMPMTRLNELADLLARRLRIERTGPRF
jgi:hypothetical protein